MRAQPDRVFGGELARFAAGLTDPRVTAIAEGVTAPLRVEVVAGRPGVGRRTVAYALACAGTAVRTGGVVDLFVYVVAEAVEPEDIAAVVALPRPVLVVLNKTDLRCAGAPADVSARLGLPTASMSGRLAVVALAGSDDTLWAALQVLADPPADLSRGWPIGRVRALLRRLSGIDAVCQTLDARGAVVRYQRLGDAVCRLEALAVGDDRIDAFLAARSTAVARASAAAAVVAAAGLTLDPDPADPAARADPAAQLQRALRWRRYRGGPVGAMHNACGTDIARCALWRWSTASSGGGIELRARVAGARVQLTRRARDRCAALRAELRDDAATLTRRGLAPFEARVCHRVHEVLGEVAADVAARLGKDAGKPEPAARVEVLRPGLRSRRLETRLMLMLGAGFGLTVTVTLNRLFAGLAGGSAAAGAVISAAAGLTGAVWLVRTRGLLHDRALLDRWIDDVVAALRYAAEELIVLRALAAEARGAGRTALNPVQMPSADPRG